jgi:hypothetical protein
VSTYQERERARRDRIDPLTRRKIAARAAEDAARVRGEPDDVSRLELGRWHWVSIAGKAWPGIVLAAVEGIGAAVGLAELGTVQVIPAVYVGRRLSGEELSNALRREPVRRSWPDGDELADSMLALNRAPTASDDTRFRWMSVSGHR